MQFALSSSAAFLPLPCLPSLPQRRRYSHFLHHHRSPRRSRQRYVPLSVRRSPSRVYSTPARQKCARVAVRTRPGTTITSPLHNSRPPRPPKHHLALLEKLLLLLFEADEEHTHAHVYAQSDDEHDERQLSALNNDATQQANYSKFLLDLILSLYPGYDRVVVKEQVENVETVQDSEISAEKPSEREERPVLGDVLERASSFMTGIADALLPTLRRQRSKEGANIEEDDEEDELSRAAVRATAHGMSATPPLHYALYYYTHMDSALPRGLSAHPAAKALGIDVHKAIARVIVAVADLLADAVVYEIFMRISQPWDILDTITGLVGAYAAADLVSGVYNWLRANFTPNVSLFGARAGKSWRANRDRSFARLVAPYCAAVTPLFAAMLWLPPGEIRTDVFWCYFLTFISLLPAFREWSVGASRPPKVVSVLQKARVVRGPNGEDNTKERTPCAEFTQYCIVSGLWNNLLTRLCFFPALERWVYVHSRGRITPKVWKVVPDARERACGPDDSLLG